MASESLIGTALDAGWNILLAGPHGVGKTTKTMQEVLKRNLDYKYFSCATMDPFTDFVGVPVPHTREDGSQELRMVRPRDIDNAEVIFFDELNRSDAKVRNAVMEIIQFRTINGEPLPKLRAIVAAINPPGDAGYDVDELDPALMDRFHLTVDIAPAADAVYFKKVFGSEIGNALVKWWNAHQKKRDKSKTEGYVSPRRLETLGLVWQTAPTEMALRAAMPQDGITYPVKELALLLREASQTPEQKQAALAAELKAEAAARAAAKTAAEAASAANAVAAKSVGSWDEARIRVAANRSVVAAALMAAPSDLQLHQKVADALSRNLSGSRLVKEYGEVFGALSAASVGSMVSKWDSAKRSQVRGAIRETTRRSKLSNDVLRKQYTALSASIFTPSTGNVLDKGLVNRKDPK